MKLVFLGAPGSGKGTVSSDISKVLSIPTISTGNILRAMIQEGTELGLKAKEYIDAGSLVPDELVLDIIKQRLLCDDCSRGFILDGFPRTIPQALALETIAAIDRAINLVVPYGELEKRMLGRRICKNCGKTYNVHYLPTKVEGICDDCGGPLIRRADDNQETIKARFEVYQKESEPLIEFYEGRGKLLTVENKDSSDLTKLHIVADLGITV